MKRDHERSIERENKAKEDFNRELNLVEDLQKLQKAKELKKKKAAERAIEGINIVK